jgi:hypothetical protein
MVQAEIDRFLVEQRLRDRQREMKVCRSPRSAIPASPSHSGVGARLQSLVRHLRAGSSAADAASATS